MNARYAFDAADGAPFYEQFKNSFHAVNGRVHSIKRVLMGLREGFGALAAAEGLKPVTTFSEASALDSGAVACHLDLDLCSGQVQNERGDQSLPLAFGLRLTLPVA